MKTKTALSAEKSFDCKVIAVANCKGGTGKSTTAINLGVGLADKGYRVLLVDNDPQGSMSLGLGIDNPDMLDYSLAPALVDMITGERVDPRKGILSHEEGVDLMPGNIELCGLEVELVEKGIKEALRKYLSFFKNDYAYIIIDCQPSLSQLTLNAFAAADSIIVPVQASYLPVKGLEQFISAVNQVKGPLNPMLRIEGILLTMVDNRTNNSKEIIRLLHKNIGGNINIFKTRNTLKYVSDKDRKAFAKDLKTIYNAPSEEEGRQALDEVKETWDERYPRAMTRWYDNWDAISPIFKFSSEVRSVIYTTNAIESLNATYRKLNRQRSVFPSDQALLKALYLSTFEATRKWTMPMRNWGRIYGELKIMYDGRLPE